MKTNLLGYPRIGANRELKKSLEKYWRGSITIEELHKVGRNIRQENWQIQQFYGIDLIPSNDFSFYDQVLDASITYGCIPERYSEIKKDKSEIELYFAMARGLQKDSYDLKAMEMTKWFDTNYHYIVPEFTKDQSFCLNSNKVINEYKEALNLGIRTKPVLISPFTYLYLGKEKERGFHRLDLLESLLPVFYELLEQLSDEGAEYIQLDEPCLALNLDKQELNKLKELYNTIALKFPRLKIILTNYFDCYGDNLDTVLQLPVHALHLDLVRCPLQLDDILGSTLYTGKQILSLGIVDGRNIWRNNFDDTLITMDKAKQSVAKDKIWIAGSCSFLHCPYDLDQESNEEGLDPKIAQWMAFSKQKLQELVILSQLATDNPTKEAAIELVNNRRLFTEKSTSELIHHPETKQRLQSLTEGTNNRTSSFNIRKERQKQELNLPLFPTTTIGSFPQTQEVRAWRSKLKRKEVTQTGYDEFIKKETEKTIRFQEDIGLDVLVHGEFERNDMVEYFGERLEGFAFSTNGWVQSYGSRCVKPPIIYGDVHRDKPMTVKWTSYAQSLTKKPVKGMLTGPVTILQWSFVRDDQPRSTTCRQIALAIRDEVFDLESTGIKIIQIDEPAIREGLPLRKEYWNTYLKWAIECFRVASSGVGDRTQIHTHMCYSEFNDIIRNISDMDADVITIETSRSEMELLDAFVQFKYPNEIGPGVYDIHSSRVPNKEEMEQLLQKATQLLPVDNIWVNPDCGLKTREWPETKLALTHMVEVAKKMRKKYHA
ncbi:MULTISPECIES: 5-methyltetrahydropteroyltriglutamate--homocysteine S-methyltransferase [unclassified Arenibacter]|uniref:5-methyltetrahydropteroyltriglutamate-- homocysteine S-methyltransferase n=1 Tax=unclassified Arenibacter TaxID=2615047 RepID=UPI000E356D77|nr:MULTISPECIES: 5-methyltetrahydropteroyltriglutamate--homocysteine S-methyltransferase [unclassified Arenibacter]MCM4162954.1 5-methyltetrahydropteroyltriglutamate--homocysteine S-methyltransferase [Arenibacter sp. A80]RFT57547.1 5-methyltetrahydropteroyltriglutamate--homocysteine S-methyltransferase [Arenibacter sp. P308M17]